MDFVTIPYGVMFSIHLFNEVLKPARSASLEGSKLNFLYKTCHWAQSPKLKRAFCQACALAFSQSTHHQNMVSDYWQLVLENRNGS